MFRPTAILHTLLSLSILTRATSLSISHHARSLTGQKVQWGACTYDLQSVSIFTVECGTLLVPLDYTDRSSNATLNLQVLRIHAATTPSRGSIFFNFRGPGDNGHQGFATYGAQLRNVTGGAYDLLAVVPRGTGNTLTFSCYSSAAERALNGLLFFPLSGNSSDTALGRLWPTAKNTVDACYARQNQTGRLVGTASTARDVMSVVDALALDGEDGMLRFWGISYGTVLGATLAGLFPDRVDKLVLDGVVNVKEYYANTESELFTMTDAVFTGFCQKCILAGPTTCALARPNLTATALESTLYAFIDYLKYNPILLNLSASSSSSNSTSGGGPFAGIANINFLFDYSTLRTVQLSVLYSPSVWPSWAVVLDELLQGKLDSITAVITALETTPPAVDDEAQIGIKCGDVFGPDDGEPQFDWGFGRTPPGRFVADEGVLDTIYKRHAKSRVAGDTADLLVMTCARWRLRAKERFAGFNTGAGGSAGGGNGTTGRIRTRRPLLLVANSFDPVTPLVGARNVSGVFEGSRLLVNDGYGHSTLVQGSLCTAKAIRAYFVNGTLPSPGTVCPVDAPVFSTDDGWAGVIKQLENGA